MGKIRLTKSELKGQKDMLRRFQHYLPVLQLKKKQLQLEIAKIHASLKELEDGIKTFKRRLFRWIAVFAEYIDFKALISVENIVVKEGNIAGVDIPVFEKIQFKEEDYDFSRLPLWADYGVEAVRDMVILKVRENVLRKQLEYIAEELRITNQRVNLFEKVKIPEIQENIRRIQIWLGDLQTAGVVTGKIAKEKIENKDKVPVLLP